VTAQQTMPNTHETVVINRIFRLEFPLLAGIVPHAWDGAGWAAHIASHIEFCLDSLHNHHGAEDEHRWRTAAAAWTSCGRQRDRQPAVRQDTVRCPWAGWASAGPQSHGIQLTLE
jgi:hypothetical protein